MAPLRCLIDTMVFDAIAGEPGVLDRVDRLTRARRLELLAAPTSIEQVAAVPSAAHRRALQRVRVLVVPPAEPIAALVRRPGVGRDDAAIAACAAAQEVPLVTEDHDLRAAAAELLPAVPLWSWADDLRPRILAL
jgi:predicted nucleic acid-binding protein